MDNNNNTWLWIFLLFGAFWLLNSQNRSTQEQLFVVGGHQQHVGLSAEDIEEGEVRRQQPPSGVHHILTRITDTHDKVRGWYEVFENLAVGSEKLLTVVTTLRK